MTHEGFWISKFFATPRLPLAKKLSKSLKEF
jgi:hypothetical protein